MQRKSFCRTLIAAVGVTQLTHVAPALALDERSLGFEVFSQMREDGEILFDSPYYEHLNEVGADVAAAVRDRYPNPIRFYIVKGSSANAFSVPGGNIYVNEPLLRLVNNKDELAGVLAHETGHMVLHHVARRIANARKAQTIGQILSLPAQIFLGPLGGFAGEAAIDQLGAAQDANLSRHIEAQADEEGARIIASRTSYNPHGMIWFFNVLTKKYGDRGTYWQRDHPSSSARVDDLERLFAQNPAIFGKYDASNRASDLYW